MKKILSLLLVFFLTSCETVSDFSMPNLGMPDLNQYKMNPFSKDKSVQEKCSIPMILADAIPSVILAVASALSSSDKFL